MIDYPRNCHYCFAGLPGERDVHNKAGNAISNLRFDHPYESCICLQHVYAYIENAVEPNWQPSSFHSTAACPEYLSSLLTLLRMVSCADCYCQLS